MARKGNEIKNKHMCQTPGCRVLHPEPDSRRCGYCRVRLGFSGRYSTANRSPDFVGFDGVEKVFRVLVNDPGRDR